MKPEKVKRFPRDPKIFDKHVLSCHFQFVNLSFYPENVPHHFVSVVTWESEIFGPYFNVVVDAIGPETDFPLETNVKE